MNLHKYITWMSLWRWRPTTLLGDVLENTFISSVAKVSYACASVTPASSQTLDDRELALSFKLSPICCLLFQRGIISSIKVAREAVLVVSVPEVVGLVGVTEAPLSITCTILALTLERGSFFLAFIHVYIPWLNFVVIPTRGKYLLKKILKK